MPKMVLNIPLQFAYMVTWQRSPFVCKYCNFTICFGAASLFVMLHEMALFPRPTLSVTYRKSYSDVDDLFSLAQQRNLLHLSRISGLETLCNQQREILVPRKDLLAIKLNKSARSCAASSQVQYFTRSARRRAAQNDAPFLTPMSFS